MQSLYKMVHVGPLATGIQSLMLLYQVMESRHVVSARYYQALYAKLLDPRLKHGGKQVIGSAVFACMLYRYVKGYSDNPPRYTRHVLLYVVLLFSTYMSSNKY